MCCKYFLLIFSVSFKGIFAKVLFSIIACVNLCLCFLGTFAYHIDSLCFFLKFIIFLFILPCKYCFSCKYHQTWIYFLFPPFCYTKDSMLALLHAFHFFNIGSFRVLSLIFYSAFDYSWVLST